MNGLHELPLIIFTVLAQSVVGAFLLLSGALSRTSVMCSCRQRAYKGIFALLVLLGVGFIASMSHLGSPLRAMNALNRVGDSMLSNEIALGGAFFASLGVYWLLGVTHRLSQNTDKLFLILTGILGVGFMYVMNLVYHIATVPTWNNAFTSWLFYLTLAIGGASLVFCLMYHESVEARKNLGWMPFFVLVMVVVALISTLYQGMQLSQLETSLTSFNRLVPDFAHLSVVRFVLLFSGVAGLFFVKAKPNLTLVKIFPVALILGAEMIGRTLFYASHMTVGLAFGG